MKLALILFGILAAASYLANNCQGGKVEEDKYFQLIISVIKPTTATTTAAPTTATTATTGTTSGTTATSSTSTTARTCGPTTLPTGGRWVSNQNCTSGNNFNILPSRERCSCWGFCGYVCRPA